MPWFVLHTKSRYEKNVADQLKAMNIDVYCPLIKVRRQWSDRVKTVEIPLFRSYCFVRLAEHDRQQVLAVTGVVRYLYWLKKPAIVRDAEIETIKIMLNEVDHNSIEVVFTPGDRLRIGSGSMIDQTGEVVQQQGTRVVLRLDSIRMVVNVDLTKNIVSKYETKK